MMASSAEELTFARVSDAEHPQRSSTTGAATMLLLMLLLHSKRASRLECA